MSGGTGKPKLDSLGIHRVMADIDINKLQEEVDALLDFAWSRESWLTYCNSKRGGKQDSEQLMKLMSSILDVEPRRFIVHAREVGVIDGTSTVLAELSKQIRGEKRD